MKHDAVMPPASTKVLKRVSPHVTVVQPARAHCGLIREQLHPETRKLCALSTGALFKASKKNFSFQIFKSNHAW